MLSFESTSFEGLKHILSVLSKRFPHQTLFIDIWAESKSDQKLSSADIKQNLLGKSGELVD